jgi:hypothetical protein
MPGSYAAASSSAFAPSATLASTHSTAANAVCGGVPSCAILRGSAEAVRLTLPVHLHAFKGGFHT